MFNPFPELIAQILPEPHASLLAGMLFGVKTSLSPTLYQALISTGTIHIVALSGQNITILTGFISSLTLGIGRRRSIILTVLMIVAFVWFVGGEPSIVRAAIMGSMQLFSIYFGRRYFSLLGLFLASGMMLLVNPAWIDDISFQLSFLATSGIILFGQTRYKNPKSFREEVVQDIKSNFRLSVAAQMATLPVILLKFRMLSLVAPLTNILISPLIGPIMILGLTLSVVSLVSHTLAGFIGYLVWVPLTYLIGVVLTTARFPYAAFTF